MSVNLDRTVFGLELGSTRIKAVLIDEDHRPIAAGDYAWENKLENGVWTYDLEEAPALRRHGCLGHDARLFGL